MGKGNAHPIALEGALKIKEIAYIQAEGYAGGALKHGPFALIEKVFFFPLFSVLFLVVLLKRLGNSNFSHYFGRQ